jgi:ELWxxDGT repeat protein
MKNKLAGAILVLGLSGLSAGNAAVFQPIAGTTTALAQLTPGNGSVFFFGYTADGGTKPQPWITDGTVAGSHAAKTILGSSGSVFPQSNPFSWKGIWYFVADDGFSGNQLWRSDGTDAGTFALTNFSMSSQGPIDLEYSLTGFGDEVIFNAELTTSYQLMATDGTVAGTQVLAPNTFTYNIGRGALINNKVIYAGGVERFIISDGTPTGSSAVSFAGTSGLTGISGTNYDGLVAVNGVAYFYGTDSTHGGELWKTDGTKANTAMVKDIFPGATGSAPGQFTRVDDRLFFVAANSGIGRELWVTDGTDAGTVLLKDIRPGVQDGGIRNMTAFNGKLYFVANDGTNGSELWVSDGTAAGTQLALGDFNTKANTGAFDSPITSFQVANNSLLLLMQGTSDPSPVPYRSDGTLAGTSRVDPTVADFIQTSTGSNPFALADGQIFAATGGKVSKADSFATLGNVWCYDKEENIPDADPDGDSTLMSASVHLPADGRISSLQVSVDIGHTWVGDLTISLVHEQTGKEIVLFNQPDSGGCDGDLLNITFDDKAATAADDVCTSNRPAYPTRGSFKPLQRLAGMNGQTIAGDWALHVVDNSNEDFGTLHNWCMRFANDSIFADDFE